MDVLTTPAEILRLQEEMMIKFCEEVEKCKTRNYSPVIKSTQSYFISVFRQFYGVTPSKYREN